MKQVWRVLTMAAGKFLQHDALMLSAALAFYTLLSLAPLVVFLVVAIGAFSEASQDLVVRNFESALGPRAGEVVTVILQNAVANRRLSSVSSILSAIVLFIAATGMFVQLQAGLNRVWEVRPKPGFRWREWLARRGVTFLMVIVIGAILLASFVLSTIVRIFVPDTAQWLPLVRLFGGLLLFGALFAVLYKYLPDTIIEWRDVLIGGLITTLLVGLGRYGLSIYFRYSSVTSVYGATSSIVVLLLIFYYSSAMLYLGAEVTRALAIQLGDPIRPADNAEWVSPPSQSPSPT
ncbi:MAG: YihY/virulence factor BrkB family protein [Armatimonadota bacterium]